MTIKVACIGESMLEFAHLTEQRGMFKQAYAGDTINMATYMMRIGQALGVTLDYITALGTDPYSTMMLNEWQQDSIGTQWVQRLNGKLPGLYLIETDAQGERTFYFYRSVSAAREMLKTPAGDDALTALPQYNLIYFSGITLSILDDASREKLFTAVTAAIKQGARVAFDSNYRPSGWPDQATARQWIERAQRLSHFCLPTLGDEENLFGDKTPQDTIARLQSYGVTDAVVKIGGDGAWVATAETAARLVATQPVAKPVDTTAAGDSFNAGYLVGRLLGHDAVKAAAWGHGLAREVIMHRGGIMPRQATPKLAA